ncbi:hypothetical protein F5Y18DRAFT_444994 [Xylariaceae sp. FL1019]|nr:hypothetical protein F5Y18DRAFT_444994 [Xylariaceae sp. FL1019]
MASGLLLLPMELILEVFENTAPGPHPTYHPHAGPIPTLDPEFAARRKALHSLSLTCSVTRDLARPLLYRTVALDRAARIVMFLATLLRKREYARLVKNFAILIDLRKAHIWPSSYVPQWDLLIVPSFRNGLTANEIVLWHFFDLPYSQCSGANNTRQGVSHRVYPLNIRLQFNRRRESEADFLLEQIVAVTLCLLTRVEDLLITHSPEDLEYVPLHRIKQALGLASEADNGILKNLRSIRVQISQAYYTGYHNPHGSFHGGLDPFALPTYELARVRSVELSGDNGSWMEWFELPNAAPSGNILPDRRHEDRLGQLRSLKLYDTKTDYSTLSVVLAKAKSLDTLHYTSESRYYGAPQFSVSPGSRVTLQNALLKVSKTLQELHLRDLRKLTCGGPSRKRDTPRRLVPKIAQQLQSLSDFSHLTRLSIDIRSLQRPPQPECVFTSTLAARLPQSLVELELVESWYYQEISVQNKSERWEEALLLWIQSILIELLRCVAGSRGALPKVNERLPNLKTIKFDSHPSFYDHESSGTDIDMREAGEDNETIDHDHYRDSDLRLQQHLEEEHNPAHEELDSAFEEIEETGAVYPGNQLRVPTYRRLRRLWADWYESGKRYRNPNPTTAFHRMYRAIDIYPQPVLLKTENGHVALAEIFKEVGVDFQVTLKKPVYNVFTWADAGDSLIDDSESESESDSD